MDTSFTPGRHHRRGYLTGSGLPVRFIDEDGTLLGIYEQATISMDDGWTTDKLMAPAMTTEECIAASRGQIDAVIDRFHTVYQPYFHPITTRPGPRSSQRWLDAVLAHCRERGLTFVSGTSWVGFNDARRGVKLLHCAWDEARGELVCTLEATHSVEGLTLAMPAVWRGRALTSATVDGEPVSVEPKQLEGRQQVLLPAAYVAGQPRRWHFLW